MSLAGATCPVLQQIVDKELADVEADGARKIYDLTAAGKRTVEESMEEVAAIWQRAASWRQWSRLDSAELADVGELKSLIRTVLDEMNGSDGSTSKAEIKSILADAAERIRQL